MRNIEASPWLGDPQLQVVETLKTGKVGADFTLSAMQKSTVSDDDAKGVKRGPVRTAALGGGH
jgi:hypothetical protein